MAITTPQPEQDDDVDSVYSDHSPLPEPNSQAREITLPPSPDLTTLEEQLDAEDSLSDGNSSDTQTIPDSPLPPFQHSSVPVIDDDDLFDSDENPNVESLPSTSSSDSIDPPDTLRISDASSTTASNPQKEKEKQVPVGGLALFTRASMTFYKAFKKTAKKPSPQPTPLGEQSVNEIQVVHSGESLQRTHARLVQLLDAQIATLNGAKTGFVDLQLLKPMTEKTLDAVQHEAQILLGDYGELEQRAAELMKQSVKTEKEGDEELAAKEQMLIAAKVRLAEASCEVDALKHDLRLLNKEMRRPDRVAAREKRMLEREREAVRLQAMASRDSRIAVQQRLSKFEKNVESDRAQLRRLDKSYRDIEGDWA